MKLKAHREQKSNSKKGGKQLSEHESLLQPQKKLLSFTRTKDRKEKLPDAKRTTGPDLEDFRDLMDDEEEVQPEEGKPLFLCQFCHGHQIAQFVGMSEIHLQALSALRFWSLHFPLTRCKSVYCLCKLAELRIDFFFVHSPRCTSLSFADEMLGTGFPRRSKSYSQRKTLMSSQSLHGPSLQKTHSRRRSEPVESQPKSRPSNTGCHFLKCFSQCIVFPLLLRLQR